VTARSRAQAGVEPPTSLAGSLLGVRVLVVEDSELNRKVTAEMLRLAGAEVTLAGNGAEAVKRASAEAFDIVLMDIQMPVMDGYEAARRIRADPRHAALPIVATTAQASPPQRLKCHEAGMNDHVAKPLAAALLVETVLRWTIRREPSKAAARQAPARAPSSSEPPADLPGFDTARALARLDANVALLRRLRDQFCHKHKGAGAEIRAAWDKGDFDRVRFMAHTIHGSASAIGADSVASAAAALEDAVREATSDHDIARLEALERALCDALNHLTQA